MAKAAKIKIKTQPVVIIEAEVARQIRQHARTSMKAEVCGVLIGTADDERTLVEACIAGINAAQGGAHVTFTQDAWEHIYKIKDKEFPEEKIVGWYHSHPGFGVFLSEHDLFIQENFFSNPQQIAWVYDPHTDEEGCFGWVNGKTEKLSGVRFGYSQTVALTGAASNNDEERDESDSPPEMRIRSTSDEPAWVKWASRSLGYLAVLGIGFATGYMLYDYRVGPLMQTCQQLADHAQACEQILRQVLPPGQLQPQLTPELQRPAPPVLQEKPKPTKGSNGKH